MMRPAWLSAGLPVCEEEGDQLGRGGHAADAHGVEGALDVVGEFGDLGEAEHRAGTLDGMEGAEEPVDAFGAVGARFDFQGVTLDLLQELGGLLEKRFGGVVGAFHLRRTG